MEEAEDTPGRFILGAFKAQKQAAEIALLKHFNPQIITNHSS